MSTHEHARVGSTAALRDEFVARSVLHLCEEYLPRIERALEVLPPGDLWWRPNEDVTSVGNLLLHLEGNVRQWILSGLGNAEDLRVRSAEFEASHSPEGEGAAELFARLASTVRAACDLIEALRAENLLERRNVQVYEGVSGLAAVLHVVEHFAWHTGQIAWIAKMRAGAGHGLRFYDDATLEGDA